jgi:hypothetical protein
MADENQKQISQRYQDVIPTYTRGHYLRNFRNFLGMVAIVGGFVAALGFRFYGNAEFFNTGPISKNHAAFANQCEACHLGASTDLLSILPFGHSKEFLKGSETELLNSLRSAGQMAMERVATIAQDATATAANPDSLKRFTDGEALKKLADATEAALSHVNIDRIDEACLRCHPGLSLHQPGPVAVAYRETSSELSVVLAEKCSSCHKEHVGHIKMADVTSQTCSDCHGDAARLKASHKKLPYKGRFVKGESQNLKLTDGRTQWVPASVSGEEAKVFPSFDKGHPPFLYERAGSVDKSTIKYNHAFHENSSQVQKLLTPAQKQMGCTACHQVDSKGYGIAPITYEAHCKQCHTLSIDPDVPGLHLPHGDPEQIRQFVGSLTVNWEDYAKKALGVRDAASLQAFLQERKVSRERRGLTSFDAFQERIFFTGDPPASRSDSGQYLPACAKCHDVQRATPVPIVAPSRIPDQWLSRGPYPHAPHLHMSCLDCHGSAKKSEKTEDINLPSMSICVECHRPRDYSKVKLDSVAALAPTYGIASPEVALKQRSEGGIAMECLDCHKYHVPAAENTISNALKNRAEKTAPETPLKPTAQR